MVYGSVEGSKRKFFQETAAHLRCLSRLYFSFFFVACSPSPTVTAAPVKSSSFHSPALSPFVAAGQPANRLISWIKWCFGGNVRLSGCTLTSWTWQGSKVGGRFTERLSLSLALSPLSKCHPAAINVCRLWRLYQWRAVVAVRGRYGLLPRNPWSELANAWMPHLPEGRWVEPPLLVWMRWHPLVCNSAPLCTDPVAPPGGGRGEAGLFFYGGKFRLF